MFPNPRFPHKCKVFHVNDSDAFGEVSQELLYDGECRNYITTRNIGDSAVKSSQYTLAIPAYRELSDDEDLNGDEEIYTDNGKKYLRIKVKALPGDKVICTDGRDEDLVGTVVDSYVGTKGNNVFWNYDAN